MSKEQAKEFFEAISEDKQLAEEVKDVLDGQATKQEKAKELLSLAKRHNFNFTEDELKRSLSREDLVDIAGGGGVLSSLGSMVVGIMQMFGVGGTGGQQPLPAPNPIVNVQPAANNANAQNEGDENEAPAANVDEEVEEIRERTPEEIAERQQREEQEPRELAERLAQGPLELDTSAPAPVQPAEGVRWLTLEQHGQLEQRVYRLIWLNYQLSVYPAGRELAERIHVCINEISDIISRKRGDFEFRLVQANSLIDEAENILRQRQEMLGDEIQRGLDALALILQRTHTGRPGETDLYTDVQTYLANRESYSREERIARAKELLNRTQAFYSTLDWKDRLRVHDEYQLFSSLVWFGEGDEQAILEERLENNALPWLASIHMQSCAPGEPELALEIQEFLTTIDDDFTDEHLAEMNSLLDRAREIMMNRARAYTRFDTDQLHIRNNDLQLAQMLGIDKEYIQEKIKNKTVASREDFNGVIELPNGDQVAFHFFVGSGTLVLTGSGNTVIGRRYDDDSLLKQLKEAGIVFEVKNEHGYCMEEQLPTPDYPFVVRNLIIGTGITDIGVRAFLWAKSLRSVYLIGPVQSIGIQAFIDNDYLVEVGFAQPEALTIIDKYAFSGGRQLVSINLPQNADIHESAFRGCRKLKKQGCPYCKDDL